MSKRLFNRIQPLRADESGEISVIGYILLVTLVGIGMVVGLATFRDQLVQEFGDIAVGLENLDQSYSITIGTKTSEFDEDSDSFPTDPPEAEPDGISVTEPSTDEM